MKYEQFSKILNGHIFEGEKKDLLRRIAESPERFLGLFRPTKPKAKILQHLLQSHEIRMGDALEEIIEEILKEIGFRTLSKIIEDKKGKQKSLDQHFTDGRIYYFIEEKIRDDHDSSKAPGQMANFEAKLEILNKMYETKLFGFMYFIDPDFLKNKNYYLQELKRLEEFYGVKLNLLYGRELFTYFKRPEIWDSILSWLRRWKDSLPELPDINFDSATQKSFEEIKDLEIRHWRKILENEKLWEEGIINVIFREGKVLKLALEFFNIQHSAPYKNLSYFLNQRIKKYY